MEKVPEAASPMPQNPLLNGDLNANLSKFNEAWLSTHKPGNSNNAMANVVIKGYDNGIISHIAIEIRSDYDSFNQCMNRDWLFQSADAKTPISAYGYFKRIPDVDSLKVLRGLMKRRLIVKISDEISTRISYLTENKIYKMSGARVPYLGPALRELVGDQKLASEGMLSKTLAFQACAFFLRVPPAFSEATAILDTAIALDSTAAYLYFLRGQVQVMDDSMNQKSGYARDLRRCMELSPRFVYSYFLLITAFLHNNNADSALYYIARMPQEDSSIIFEIANTKVKAYFLIDQPDSVKKYSDIMEVCLANKPSEIVNEFYMHNLALTTYFQIKDYHRAVKYGETFDRPSLSGNSFWYIYLYMSKAYAQLNDPKESLRFLEKVIASGAITFGKVTVDPDLKKIKDIPEFKALMKKYFPDQYKE